MSLTGTELAKRCWGKAVVPEFGSHQLDFATLALSINRFNRRGDSVDEGFDLAESTPIVREDEIRQVGQSAALANVTDPFHVLDHLVGEEGRQRFIRSSPTNAAFQLDEAGTE